MVLDLYGLLFLKMELVIALVFLVSALVLIQMVKDIGVSVLKVQVYIMLNIIPLCPSAADVH